MCATAATAAGYFHSESTCGLGRASGLRNWPCKFSQVGEPRRRIIRVVLGDDTFSSYRVTPKSDLDSTTDPSREERPNGASSIPLRARVNGPIKFLMISLRFRIYTSHASNNFESKSCFYIILSLQILSNLKNKYNHNQS